MLSSEITEKNILRIATWNVERPNLTTKREREKVTAINAKLSQLAADIIILTETNACISPGEGYFVSSSLPLDSEQEISYYKDGERRVIICSRFPIIRSLPVTNPKTTLCVLIETPYGPLAIFGCIIGIHGRGKGFDIDLHQQVEDLKRLAKEHQLCYAGDLNLSFCDKYYTKSVAKIFLEETFSTLRLENLTANIPENIDHIVISKSYLGKGNVQTDCWNEEKNLSDHKGVIVTLQR